jgi:hypothetical protein
MRCNGPGCFNAVLREWMGRGGSEATCLGGRCGETRRDEMRERARALKSVRTQHKPNNRSIGSGSLEEATRAWRRAAESSAWGADAQNSRAKRHTWSSPWSRERGSTRQGGSGVRRLSVPSGPCPWAAAAKRAHARSSDSRDDDKGQAKHKQSGARAERARCVADVVAGPLTWLQGCLLFCLCLCKGRLAHTHFGFAKKHHNGQAGFERHGRSERQEPV